MNFDIKNPSTWIDLGKHPFYTKGLFSKDWYNGDIDEDLLMLRSACLMILESFKDYNCKIYVDEGCNVYVELYKKDQLIAELYPSVTSSNQTCLYFYLFEHPKDELRVPTAEEAKKVIWKIEHNSDLSEYTDDY